MARWTYRRHAVGATSAFREVAGAPVEFAGDRAARGCGHGDGSVPEVGPFEHRMGVARIRKHLPPLGTRQVGIPIGVDPAANCLLGFIGASRRHRGAVLPFLVDVVSMSARTRWVALELSAQSWVQRRRDRLEPPPPWDGVGLGSEHSANDQAVRYWSPQHRVMVASCGAGRRISRHLRGSPQGRRCRPPTARPGAGLRGPIPSREPGHRLTG
jgi:hypothetical protein